jgi:hypothetical protein
VSCKPHDLLEWSDAICGRTTSEADRRAAISQAYYACFHKYVEGIGSVLPNPDAGKHQDLIQVGLHHAVRYTSAVRRPKIESNLSLLEKLRRVRGKANYELGTDITRAELQVCIDDAHQIIDNLMNIGRWVGEIPQVASLIPRRR